VATGIAVVGFYQAVQDDPSDQPQRIGAATRRPKFQNRWIRAIALAAVLVVVCTMWWVLARHRPGPPAPVSPKASRRSVAVLGLRNLSGRWEDASLATALAE